MFNILSAPKTGTDLEAALKKPDQEDKPLVSELLYPGESTFITADPAVGKSTLATQIALSVTSGEPVFNLFEVSHPATVYYIALETRWKRQVTLIRKMRRRLSPNLANWCWHDPVGLDFTAPPRHGETNTDIERLITFIKKTWTRPGLVVLDPLYLTVNKDLKDGDAANAVSRFINKLMTDTGCAVLVLHHTHRERYDIKGKRIVEEDPIYGSRWLQAHMALGWNVTKTETGTKWKRGKDRFNLSRKEFSLEFDPVTALSGPDNHATLSVLARIEQFLWSEPVGNELTYEQIASAIKCHVNYAKITMLKYRTSLERFAEMILGTGGNPTIWRIKSKANVSEPAPYENTGAMDEAPIS